MQTRRCRRCLDQKVVFLARPDKDEAWLIPWQRSSVPNSPFFFDDHNTTPNVLDDVFGLRPRYLLPIDVDREQTRIASPKCLVVQSHADIFIPFPLEGQHNELLSVVYRPNPDGSVLSKWRTDDSAVGRERN